MLVTRVPNFTQLITLLLSAIPSYRKKIYENESRPNHHHHHNNNNNNFDSTVTEIRNGTTEQAMKERELRVLKVAGEKWEREKIVASLSTHD